MTKTNKYKKKKITFATRKKKSINVEQKMHTYIHYIHQLKKNLINTKNLFSVVLPKLSQKEFAISSEFAFDHAEMYYHQEKNNSPIQYPIIGSDYTLQYNAMNNDTNQICGIAKGTFYLKYKPPIVNFYQIQSSSLPEMEIFRFGTPVYSFQYISSIVQNILYFRSNKKKMINISLLSPCNSFACTKLALVAKPLSSISTLFKKGLSATKEDDIIHKELNGSNKNIRGIIFHSILFPLSSQIYTGVGSSYLPTISTFEYDKESLKTLIKDTKVRKIYDYIDLQEDYTGKKAFASIVKIAMYYFLFLKDEYILCYHCKSGKDRTSVFDAIIQSTFYYLYSQLQHHNNIIQNTEDIHDIQTNVLEIIRKYSQSFLLYGFIIAFQSTGIVGLKLKNITIAKYIFHDNKKLFHRFIGHSSMVSS
jgi:hypothetical protein